eukprot:CAMPEP_0174892540 /NCGR_PEP_ID=MMETSP0167-20121228/7472_1 /TAXON_ID=38298 /ORGANISM="Rhodella maculata, Strain CCMP736" /LENGTH=332 /DNA_ID=CAMNT_0016131061 /DNA_START=58 /DNA_END=1056 /DNA_ORIENTATION=+
MSSAGISRRSGKEEEEIQDRGFKEVKASLEPYLLQLGTYLSLIGSVLDKTIDYIKKLYKIIEPYHPDELVPALIGLIMTFFGGTFMTTIAFFTAAKTFGWEKISTAIVALYKNLKTAADASRKDDKVDADNDGKADVDELQKHELAARKALLIAKTIDPQEVAAAIEGLVTAWMAILATLKIEFAAAITFGVNLGNIFEECLEPLLTPIAQRAIPYDFYKWYPVVLQYTCRSVGVSIAWFIRRVMSATYSSFKGSELMFYSLAMYISRNKIMDIRKVQPGSLLFNITFTIVAVVGLYWQLSNLFRLPFPLNILLLPLTIFEKFLIYSIAIKK